MTIQSSPTFELPTTPSVIDYVSLFRSPDLQQQAETIENAVAGFYRNTVNSLVHQGDELNNFLKSCRDRLGDKNGKAAFKEWLESGKFGQTNYIAKAAMTISDCFSELDDDTKELARKNANTWSVAALKAFAKAAKVSMLLLKALVKRKGLGPVSEKHITNLTNLLKVQQHKQPKLPLGEFVEITVDDERMKGKIGTIIDKEDEHGNIVVQVLDSAAHVILKRQDMTKKPPKAASKSLLKVIENLHEESLQKELQLSELQSVINTAPTTELLSQSERDKIVADAIAAYKQSQAEKEAVLHEELRNAALAEANAKIEASNKIIQRLTQQLENKERLAQEVAELQQQLELQNQDILRSPQLKEERQKLEQQVVKLREKLHHIAGNLASDNQKSIKVEKNLDNQQNYRDNSSTIAASQRDDDTKGLLSQPVFLLNQQKQEQNEYQGQQREKLTAQREVAELKKQIEISQRMNNEVVEANEILLETMKAFRVESGRKKVKKSTLAMEMNLSNNNNRGNLTAPKPQGFKIRTSSR